MKNRKRKGGKKSYRKGKTKTYSGSKKYVMRRGGRKL